MKDKYTARGFFRNGHFNTLYAYLFDRVSPLPFSRERLVHPVGFSLFLDWVQQQNRNLVVFTHGLESSSHARYISKIGPHFLAADFDVLAWNCRNCAQNEPFQKQAYYHSGISEDLDFVVQHVLKTQNYDNIVLMGFSMGGNIMLKYLGEQKNALPAQIKRAMAVSAPVDLMSCSYALTKLSNKIYDHSFLKSILNKISTQTDDFAHYGLDPQRVLNCKNLREFDHEFTAPVHGFLSQDDYYQKASALSFLPEVPIPTLLMNAMDDPILGDACYPSSEQVNNQNMHLIYPRYGGHMGFSNRENWFEKTALSFLFKRL